MDNCGTQTKSLLISLHKLNTSEINGLPEDVFLGYSPIKDDLSPDVLSEKEFDEWASFTNEQRKSEYLTARFLFKEMMHAHFENKDIRLSKHPLGKPFATLESKEIYVSFSHSKDHVFCAISDHVDIGLDTEWLDREVHPKLVKRILGEEEWKVFSDEDPILLWTIKEAAVKCLGTGLRTNLKELTILKKGENKFSVKINNEKSFQICSFQKLNHQITIAF